MTRESFVRSGAPFDQIVEYRGWIQRLEAVEGNRERERMLREGEEAAEREEMRERIEMLNVTLETLKVKKSKP